MLPGGPRPPAAYGGAALAPPEPWSPPATAEEMAKARGRAHQLISLLDDGALWRLAQQAIGDGLLEALQHPDESDAAPAGVGVAATYPSAAPGRVPAAPPGAFAPAPVPMDGSPAAYGQQQAAAAAAAARAVFGAQAAPPAAPLAAQPATAAPRQSSPPSAASRVGAAAGAAGGNSAPARPRPPGPLQPRPPAAQPSAEPAPGAAPSGERPTAAAWGPPLPEQREAGPRDGAGEDRALDAEEPEVVLATVDEATATSLIIRNLNPSFTQEGFQRWLDEQGYRDAYDFALFFPARKTSRLSVLPYAFVNFVMPAHAQRIKRELHLTRSCHTEGAEDAEDGGRPPLSIAYARRQGFAEYYGQFAQFLRARTTTQCRPFFADEAVARLSQEERQVAVPPPPPTAPVSDGGDAATPPCTTLIVRNVSVSVADQDAARKWFNSLGFEGQYDFFLFFPGKTKRRTIGSEAIEKTPGYFFVNFISPGFAQKCREQVDGKMCEEAPLNVVASRKQGMKDLIQHFSTLGENGGRMVPWLGGRMRSFQ